MSAVIIAAKRPVLNGLISSSAVAAPRSRAAFLGIPIAGRNIPVHRIGSMRLHTNSSNIVDKYGANASSNATLKQVRRRDVPIHRIGSMRLHTNSVNNMDKHAADASPSAISEQIRQLEKSIGARLDGIEARQREDGERVKKTLDLMNWDLDGQHRAVYYYFLPACGVWALYSIYTAWKNRATRREFENRATRREVEKISEDAEKRREDERRRREDEEKRREDESRRQEDERKRWKDDTNRIRGLIRGEDEAKHGENNQEQLDLKGEQSGEDKAQLVYEAVQKCLENTDFTEVQKCFKKAGYELCDNK